MKETVRILAVDDEEIVRESLSNWLLEDGYDVVAVESGFIAIEKVKKGNWNILLVDLKMPGMDGLQVLEEVKKLKPDIPVIIITAYATVDTAVKAMKDGAYDYLVKPFNPEELSISIKKIIVEQRLRKEVSYLRKELKKRTVISSKLMSFCLMDSSPIILVLYAMALIASGMVFMQFSKISRMSRYPLVSTQSLVSQSSL